MSIQHKKLASGEWNNLRLVEQLANVGSEVVRAINWKNKDNIKYAQMAFERALELFDLTIADPKNKKRLKEITRTREIFADYFFGENIYNTTEDDLKNYFYSFNYAARI